MKYVPDGSGPSIRRWAADVALPAELQTMDRDELVDADHDSVQRHRRLVEADQVGRVHGADPDSLRPRTSYLPSDGD